MKNCKSGIMLYIAITCTVIEMIALGWFVMTYYKVGYPASEFIKPSAIAVIATLTPMNVDNWIIYFREKHNGKEKV